MSIVKFINRAFQMSGGVWARHANPWSVWTRYSCLPLFALAIWSRLWIGDYAYLAVAIVIFWTWLNPRLFSKPSTTNHWASKAVMGERIWLAHPKQEIPPHHHTAILILNLLTMAGFLLAIYGLVMLHFLADRFWHPDYNDWQKLVSRSNGLVASGPGGHKRHLSILELLRCFELLNCFGRLI